LSLAFLAADAALAAALTPASSADLQRRANGVLMIMGYSLTPDVTTGSLAISNQSTGNPGLSMVSLGGGDVLSQSLPLYLEGTLALSRYDPTFVAASGSGAAPLPVRWNSVSGTGGIGWNFPLTERLKLRPIFNLSLGHVESDLSLADRVIQQRSGREFEFLQRGRLNALGLGGSVMIDYEDYRPEREIDAELGWLFELLELDGSLDQTWTVITSDQTLDRLLQMPRGHSLRLVPLDVASDAIGTDVELVMAAIAKVITRDPVVAVLEPTESARQSA
jgi:hypothetical protein